MQTNNITASIDLPNSPSEVFAAIANVRGWWPGEIEGTTDALGAEFTYRNKTMHRSTQRITEWVPERRIVWHVTDSELTFVADRREWDNTDIVFELARKGDGTELRFSHVGIGTAAECYDKCCNGWTWLVTKSIPSLLATGKAATRSPAPAVPDSAATRSGAERR